MMFQNHSYGPQVRLLDNPLLHGILARLCSPDCVQPEILRLIEVLYTHLIATVVNQEFECEKFEIKTRMAQYHPGQLLSGSRIQASNRAVCVNLARAGTFPSHIVYQFLHNFIEAQNLRQDHVFAARLTNSNEQVTGTHLGDAKIGGSVAGAYVLFPDPMGATGNTIVSTINHYKRTIPGSPKKFLCLHLIVTPEYLKNVLRHHPEISIYALRLDRGMSSRDILKSPLGSQWDLERGLNDRQYIVPGGGGFGEIMNNSFI